MRLGEYEIHPAADIFPMMPDSEFTELKNDIDTHGLREPIVLCDGQLIDGRNRYKACMDLGIDPQWSELEDTSDPVAFVMSANLHRRHLTASQRATCAAKVATLTRGRPSETNPQNCGITTDDAARTFNVSARSVETARKVLNESSAPLFAAVESGDITVSMAAKLVDTVPDKREQSRLVKEGPAAIREAVKAESPAKLPKPIVSLPDDASESEVAEVETWLEQQDERPVVERFKALWNSTDKNGRTLLRTCANEWDPDQ